MCVFLSHKLDNMLNSKTLHFQVLYDPIFRMTLLQITSKKSKKSQRTRVVKELGGSKDTLAVQLISKYSKKS